MKVFELILRDSDTTEVLGVFKTEDLAQEHIDWCLKNDSSLNVYNFDIDIIERLNMKFDVEFENNDF